MKDEPDNRILECAVAGRTEVIVSGDKALEDGSIDRVVTLLTDAVREGLHKRFHATYHRKNFDKNDVRAGREFVEAYVPYIHYVESLWQIAAGAGAGHHSEHEAHVH